MSEKPTLTVGISGTTNKYSLISDANLAGPAGDSYYSRPANASVGGTESIIITYVQNGASAGSARVIVAYR